MKILKTSFAFFFCVLILSALFLTGCSKEPPTLSQPMTADLTVTEKTGEDTDVTMHLTSDESGVTISVTAPEELSGVTYRYDTDGLAVEYDGMRCIADEDYLPQDSFQQVLYEICRALSNAAYQSSEEDTDVFLVPTKNGDAAVTAKDGMIQSITPSWGSYLFSAE